MILRTLQAGIMAAAVHFTRPIPTGRPRRMANAQKFEVGSLINPMQHIPDDRPTLLGRGGDFGFPFHP